MDKLNKVCRGTGSLTSFPPTSCLQCLMQSNQKRLHSWGLALLVKKASCVCLISKQYRYHYSATFWISTADKRCWEILLILTHVYRSKGTIILIIRVKFSGYFLFSLMLVCDTNEAAQEPEKSRQLGTGTGERHIVAPEWCSLFRAIMNHTGEPDVETVEKSTSSWEVPVCKSKMWVAMSTGTWRELSVIYHQCLSLLYFQFRLTDV